MSKTVTSISATGSSKSALGKLFIAKPDASGRYVLNSKKSAAASGTSTNYAINKIYALDLTEAARLLQTDEYLIDLKGVDGQRALRARDSVKIEYAPSDEVPDIATVTSNSLPILPLKKNKTEWQKVFDAVRRLNVPCSRRRLLNELHMSEPEFKEGNLDADLRLITVNDFARGHHQGHEPPRTDRGHRYDLLFKRRPVGSEVLLYEQYDPAIHGIWELYRSDTVTTKSKMRTREFSTSMLSEELEVAELLAEQSGDFSFIDEPDARARISRAIVIRRGQAAFRRALFDAYEGTCAVTGCNTMEVLEAAHIVPYRGAHTNRVDNGLLLRADVHTLFDLGHLWVDQGLICLSAHLKNTNYSELEQTFLRLPRKKSDRPSIQALAIHASTARKHVISV